MGLVGKERVGSNDKQVILQAGFPDFFEQADDQVGSAAHTQCSIETFVCCKRLSQAPEALFRRCLAAFKLRMDFLVSGVRGQTDLHWSLLVSRYR